MHLRAYLVYIRMQYSAYPERSLRDGTLRHNPRSVDRVRTSDVENCHLSELETRSEKLG